MPYKKFLEDLGVLWITQFINALSGLIILPIITKLLGAENYGVWIQILVTIGLIAPIATLGLPFALVRFLAGEKNKEKIQDDIWSVFTLISGVAVVIALILVFFSFPVSKFLGVDKIFVLISALIIIFECLSQTLGNIFRAFQQIKKISVIGIAGKLAESGMVILSIFLGYGLFGAILSILIVKIIGFIVVSAIVIKEIGIKIPKFWRMKEYLLFGLPGIIGSISSWITQSSDRYFIGVFLGTLFVGYYSPAYTLGCILTFLIGPIVYLLPATLSKYHDGNETEKVENYMAYSLKYFLVIAVPSVFGLSVLSKQLLTIFSTYSIAQNSYFVTPFVALSMLFMGVCGIIGQSISLKKKTHIEGIIILIAAVLNLGLNFILVPYFGLLGAAITTLLAYAFILIATWYYSSKKLSFKFRIDWNFISKTLIASVLMSILILWFNPLGLWKTLGAVFAGTIVYFLFIIIFKGLDEKEITLLKNVFAKKS